MTVALIRHEGPWWRRVISTSYHANAATALYEIGRRTNSESDPRWRKVECWEVLPGPMGLPDKKIKLKWKLKRNV